VWNPGSAGHPELCPRPCLYFSAGECVNGATCEFCHRPHPKRPAHLNKRHRQLLRTLPFHDTVGIVIPIIREKLRVVDEGDTVLPLIVELETLANEMSTCWQTPLEPQRAREKLALQGALRALSLRSLLTTLHRMTPAEARAERYAVNGILLRLRARCQLPMDVLVDGTDMLEDEHDPV